LTLPSAKNGQHFRVRDCVHSRTSALANRQGVAILAV
jgi:hypothetical protein